jgi:hypothetical protein
MVEGATPDYLATNRALSASTQSVATGQPRPSEILHGSVDFRSSNPANTPSGHIALLDVASECKRSNSLSHRHVRPTQPVVRPASLNPGKLAKTLSSSPSRVQRRSAKTASGVKRMDPRRRAGGRTRWLATQTPPADRSQGRFRWEILAERREVLWLARACGDFIGYPIAPQGHGFDANIPARRTDAPRPASQSPAKCGSSSAAALMSINVVSAATSNCVTSTLPKSSDS